jgi:phospholipase/lecithinase/hemolysin
MLRVRQKCCIALLAVGCSLQPASAQNFSAIVAFGDSLSDLGNTFNDLGDELSNFIIGYNSYYYDQGRWSDGPLWVEDLARLFGMDALQPNDGDNLYGTDFAWGGATSGAGTTFVPPDFHLSNLQDQVRFYIKLLSTKDARMPKVSETLFSVWSGGNDVIYRVQDYFFYTPASAQTIANNVGAAITTLYGLGGRYFLVPNLPPLGDKPNYRTNPKYQEEANDFVNAYNPLLKSKLTDLQQNLAGITIVWFDVHQLFIDVVGNPTGYGLVNVIDPAFTSDESSHDGSVVANPDQYLFWDVTHPTRAGHKIVAKAAYAAIQMATGTPLGQVSTLSNFGQRRRDSLALAGRTAVGW